MADRQPLLNHTNVSFKWHKLRYGETEQLLRGAGGLLQMHSFPDMQIGAQIVKPLVVISYGSWGKLPSPSPPSSERI